MDDIIKIIEIINPVTLAAMGVMFWFFYQRIDIKIGKLDQKIDNVEIKLRDEIKEVRNEIKTVDENLRNEIKEVRNEIKTVDENLRNEMKAMEGSLRNEIKILREEMTHNTKEINSRIDSLYGFMFTFCSIKRSDLVNNMNNDEGNKAA